MARCIDAEIAEKSLRQYAEQKHANGEIELANGILKAVCKLKTLPAADVKEVVRGKWIKFELEYDEEEKVEMLSCKLPDDEEEIIVTDGKNVWEDTFLRDVGECYLDSGYEFITGVTHWMPLPEPPKE
ncbi:DUF551 domain-containing protein [Anaerotignum sp.]|uniref:DUF551 domain-containing protein n=1 Tax=Anaerotignum sp. TaxID=2039241 RepID=UPI0028AD324B|nr:DUF551 domain-containing protein [Anaerotignum sp.]